MGAHEEAATRRRETETSCFSVGFWFSACVALHNTLRMRMGYGRKGWKTGCRLTCNMGDSLMLQANYGPQAKSSNLILFNGPQIKNGFNILKSLKIN